MEETEKQRLKTNETARAHISPKSHSIQIHLKKVFFYWPCSPKNLKLNILWLIERKAIITTQGSLKATSFRRGVEGNHNVPVCSWTTLYQQSEVYYCSKRSFSWWFGNHIIHMQVWMMDVKIIILCKCQNGRIVHASSVQQSDYRIQIKWLLFVLFFFASQGFNNKANKNTTLNILMHASSAINICCLAPYI